MASSKLSVSVPDWLEPIIRQAAERDGTTISAWLTETAKTTLIAREAAERRSWEAEHGIDRRAELEAAEEEFLADRAARGVAGAA